MASPSNGTAVVAEGNSNTVTYTPNTGFNGTAGFDYALSDGTGTDRATPASQKTMIKRTPAFRLLIDAPPVASCLG